MYALRDFGGPDVACWPLVLKFEGSNPSDFSGQKKNPQHAFLGGEVKACPMSQICGM
jgi:hypothetical protein